MPEGEKDSNPPEYPVGYGKPPQSTRFRKGISGNPRGRPKGAKNIGTILAQLGRKRVTITTNGRTRAVSMLEAMILQMMSRAAAGDLKAIRETLAAHQLHVVPKEVTEPETVIHERDAITMNNLLRRLSVRGTDEDQQ